MSEKIKLKELLEKVQRVEEPTPDLLKVMKESNDLTEKVSKLQELRSMLYEELAVKAQAVYASEIERLVGEVRELLRVDQDLKDLEVQTLQMLKQVLAKY